MLIDAFVERGIKLDAKNDKGNTLLHLAVEINGLDIAKKLVAMGADIGKINGAGFFQLILRVRSAIARKQP